MAVQMPVFRPAKILLYNLV
ncbi:hypothetical protein M3J09_006480 [Ascochyta lentis]